MKPGGIVIVNLRNPSERVVGRLMEIGLPGVTVRGLDLGAFEDWINDIAAGEDGGVRPTTVFLPMHRIEKVMLDEGVGGIGSLADTFRARVGTPITDHLE